MDADQIQPPLSEADKRELRLWASSQRHDSPARRASRLVLALLAELAGYRATGVDAHGARNQPSPGHPAEAARSGKGRVKKGARK